VCWRKAIDAPPHEAGVAPCCGGGLTGACFGLCARVTPLRSMGVTGVVQRVRREFAAQIGGGVDLEAVAEADGVVDSGHG